MTDVHHRRPPRLRRAGRPPAARHCSAKASTPTTTVCAAFEGDDGQWQLAIHFREAAGRSGGARLVALAAGDAAARALTFEPVAAADWVAQSLAGLPPVRAGRFIVHGAHDRARVPPNAIGIEIEAALAFGTGHHGTTRGCLLALDDLAKRGRARRVLDLGTGSGVLAIAAAKVLRTRVLATDIDRSRSGRARQCAAQPRRAHGHAVARGRRQSAAPSRAPRLTI